MADSSRSSPITFSGMLPAGDEPLMMADPSSHIGSNSSSLQNESLLSDSVEVGSTANADAEFGFQRQEFGKEAVVGTVQFHERHVFLCYKTPQVWPSHVEAAESDRLPRLLSAALAARKGDMKKRTRLTICEGEDGTESSNGDVLIFPEMIRYRRLTHFDVDTFVEEVFVKDFEWLPGSPESITGSYVFVCAHGNRDRRCGVCGPVLIKRFKDEIISRGLQDQVSVSPCSHVGGHKYAGNVVIFSPINGVVTGHWYGYVASDDVPMLLEQHIGKGEVIDHLWRGQMGLTEEDQKRALDLRLQLNSFMERNAKESLQADETDGPVSDTPIPSGGCCQGSGGFTCCQNGSAEEKLDNNGTNEQKTGKNLEDSEKDIICSSKKGPSSRKVCSMPTWYETWEREDTYAALAVVAAAASVFVAYSCYKQLK